MFKLLRVKIRATNPASFLGVCVNDIPIVEDLVQVNIFLYDIVFVDGTMIGEVGQKSVDKLTIQTYHTNFTSVIFFRSMCFSKLFASLRVILSSTEHQI